MKVSTETARCPATIALFQNLPNPFSDSTFVTFVVSEHARWELKIEAPQGGLVRRFEGNEGGTVTLSWDGENQDGQAVPDGTYLLRLESDGRSDCRRMILIR